MKAIFALFLIVLVANAQVDDWQTCADAVIKTQQDLVNLGAQIEDAVVQKFIPDVKNILEVCKHGEEDGWAQCALSVTGFANDVVKFGQVIQANVTQTIIPDIKAIMQLCKKEDIPGDWETCVEDIGKIVELAPKIADDIKSFNIQALIEDVQALYQLVQKALTDCTQSEQLEQDEWNDMDYWDNLEIVNDKAQCLDDIKKIVSLVNKIKSDIKRFKIKDLRKHINELYSMVQKALKDCKS